MFEKTRKRQNCQRENAILQKFKITAKFRMAHIFCHRTETVLVAQKKLVQYLCSYSVQRANEDNK
jgi:hypothetical protein